MIVRRSLLEPRILQIKCAGGLLVIQGIQILDFAENPEFPPAHIAGNTVFKLTEGVLKRRRKARPYPPLYLSAPLAFWIASIPAAVALTWLSLEYRREASWVAPLSDILCTIASFCVSQSSVAVHARRPV